MTSISEESLGRFFIRNIREIQSSIILAVFNDEFISIETGKFGSVSIFREDTRVEDELPPVLVNELYLRNGNAG